MSFLPPRRLDAGAARLLLMARMGISARQLFTRHTLAVSLFLSFFGGVMVSHSAEDGLENLEASLFGEAWNPDGIPEALEPIQEGGTDYSGEAAEALTLASEEELKKIIPEAFLIRLAVGGIYDDNLFLTEEDQVGDTVMQGQANFTIRSTKEGKSSFSVSYGATGFVYLDNSDLNAVNHSLGLAAGLNLAKTQLGLSANYQRIAGGDTASLQKIAGGSAGASVDSLEPDTGSTVNQQSEAAERETGTFNTRDNIAAGLNLNREIGAKTSFSASLGYSGTLYQEGDFQDQQDYTARLGLNYALSGKTSLGVAGTFGYLDNGDNASQTYQNFLLTAAYNPGGKFQFRGEAGVEFRQYGKRQAAAPAETELEPIPIVAAAVAPEPLPVETQQPAPVVTTTPSTPATSIPPGAAGADAPPVDPVDSTAPPLTSPAPTATSTPAVAESPPAPAPEPTPVNDYTVTDLQEEDSTRFVFNLQATYQLRVRTALRLSASRGTDGSATLGAPSIERTTMALGLEQGLGRRFALALEGGYELADYGETLVSSPTEPGAFETIHQEQRYWFSRASLNFMPRPNASIGVFYEMRSNDAGATGLNYEASRVGVQAAISF